MVTDGDMFVVGKQRLLGTEELTHARGVVEGGIEVGVVGDVNRFDESGAADGVKRSLGGLPAIWLDAGMEKGGEGFAEQRPGTMPERHERIESRGLAGFEQSRGKQIRRGACMEVEKVNTDGCTEMLLAFMLEGPVGQVRQWEVGCWIIGFGKPALMS